MLFLGFAAVGLSMVAAWLLKLGQGRKAQRLRLAYFILSGGAALASFAALILMFSPVIAVPLWLVLMGLAGVTVAVIAAQFSGRRNPKPPRRTKKALRAAPRKAALTVPHVTISGVVTLVLSFILSMALAALLPLIAELRALTVTMLFPLIWMVGWLYASLSETPGRVYGGVASGTLLLATAAAADFAGIL